MLSFPFQMAPFVLVVRDLRAMKMAYFSAVNHVRLVACASVAFRVFGVRVFAANSFKSHFRPRLQSPVFYRALSGVYHTVLGY